MKKPVVGEVYYVENFEWFINGELVKKLKISKVKARKLILSFAQELFTKGLLKPNICLNIQDAVNKISEHEVIKH
jgi:hypothetical protein